MTTHRTKQVSHLVDAVQITRDLIMDPQAWPSWLAEAWDSSPTEVGSIFRATNGSDNSGSAPYFMLNGAVGGLSRVKLGDYLVRGGGGLIIMIKKEQFEHSYEVDPDAT